MNDLILGIVIGAIVFIVSSLMGAVTALMCFRYGVKMLDRIRHDQEPFEDRFIEDEVQVNTDGTYEEVR